MVCARVNWIVQRLLVLETGFMWRQLTIGYWWVLNQHTEFESGILSERTHRQLTTPILEDVRGTPLTIDVLLKYFAYWLSTSKASNNFARTIGNRFDPMTSSLFGSLSMAQRVLAFAM